MPSSRFLAIVVAGVSLIPGPARSGESPTPAIAERLPAYSIVGLIYFGDDGESDRALLHDVLKASRCTIDNEIDDQGVRKPAGGRITARTKLLIVGEIPAPEKIADPQTKKIAERIQSHYRHMLAEAREAGVRVVSFDDLFRFGGPRRPPQTSGLYMQSKRVRRLTSSGQTSGIYRRLESAKKDGNR